MNNINEYNVDEKKDSDSDDEFGDFDTFKSATSATTTTTSNATAPTLLLSSIPSDDPFSAFDALSTIDNAQLSEPPHWTVSNNNNDNNMNNAELNTLGTIENSFSNSVTGLNVGDPLSEMGKVDTPSYDDLIINNVDKDDDDDDDEAFGDFADCGNDEVRNDKLLVEEKNKREEEEEDDDDEFGDFATSNGEVEPFNNDISNKPSSEDKAPNVVNDDSFGNLASMNMHKNISQNNGTKLSKGNEFEFDLLQRATDKNHLPKIESTISPADLPLTPMTLPNTLPSLEEKPPSTSTDFLITNEDLIVTNTVEKYSTDMATTNTPTLNTELNKGEGYEDPFAGLDMGIPESVPLPMMESTTSLPSLANENMAANVALPQNKKMSLEEIAGLIDLGGESNQNVKIDKNDTLGLDNQSINGSTENKNPIDFVENNKDFNEGALDQDDDDDFGDFVECEEETYLPECKAKIDSDKNDEIVDEEDIKGSNNDNDDGDEKEDDFGGFGNYGDHEISQLETKNNIMVTAEDTNNSMWNNETPESILPDPKDIISGKENDDEELPTLITDTQLLEQSNYHDETHKDKLTCETNELDIPNKNTESSEILPIEEDKKPVILGANIASAQDHSNEIFGAERSESNQNLNCEKKKNDATGTDEPDSTREQCTEERKADDSDDEEELKSTSVSKKDDDVYNASLVDSVDITQEKIQANDQSVKIKSEFDEGQISSNSNIAPIPSANLKDMKREPPTMVPREGNCFDAFDALQPKIENNLIGLDSKLNNAISQTSFEQPEGNTTSENTGSLNWMVESTNKDEQNMQNDATEQEDNEDFGDFVNINDKRKSTTTGNIDSMKNDNANDIEHFDDFNAAIKSTNANSDLIIGSEKLIDIEEPAEDDFGAFETVKEKYEDKKEDFSLAAETSDSNSPTFILFENISDSAIESNPLKSENNKMEGEISEQEHNLDPLGNVLKVDGSAENSEDDEFGAFEEVIEGDKVYKSKSPPSDSNDDFGDFGDFSGFSEPSNQALDIISVQVDKPQVDAEFDAFGAFEKVETLVSTEIEQKDGFANFNAFEDTSGSGANHVENLEDLNNDIPVSSSKNLNGDDDFGDFGGFNASNGEPNLILDTSERKCQVDDSDNFARGQNLQSNEDMNFGNFDDLTSTSKSSTVPRVEPTTKEKMTNGASKNDGFDVFTDGDIKKLNSVSDLPNEKKEQNPQQTEGEDCFGTLESIEVSQSKEPKTEELTGDDDFGAFENVGTENSEASEPTQETAKKVTELGSFEVIANISDNNDTKTCAKENLEQPKAGANQRNDDGDGSDDDFGDFDTFEEADKSVTLKEDSQKFIKKADFVFQKAFSFESMNKFDSVDDLYNEVSVESILNGIASDNDINTTLWSEIQIINYMNQKEIFGDDLPRLIIDDETYGTMYD